MHSVLLRSSALVLMATGVAIAQPPNQPGNQAPKPGTNTEAVSAVEDSIAALVGRVSAEMTSTTNGFVSAAAVSDMYEVEAGRLAATRGRSAEVKAFGQMMVDAHSKTSAELKSILSTDKINVNPPTVLDNRRQGMLNNLKGASAAEFDHRYMVQQVAAHREARALFEGYSKDGDNAAVKAFAAKTLPAIRTHLSHAEDLNKKIK